MKVTKWEVSLPLLVEYLAWRDTGHTAKTIIEIFRLICLIEPEHIFNCLIEAPLYVPFTQRLRTVHGYSWLTAREAVIVFNLAVIQNRYPNDHTLLTQLDDSYDNNHFIANFPQLALLACRRKTVATPNPLLVKAAKAAKTQKRRASARLRVQGEQVSLFLLRNGGDNTP